MEREYKWKSTAQDFDDILTYLALTETEPVSMADAHRKRRTGLLLKIAGYFQ